MIRKKTLIITALSVLFFVAECFAIEEQRAAAFTGQDLYLSGDKVISYQLSTSKHCLVFTNGFSMSIGGGRFSSNAAVLFLESKITEVHGRQYIDYSATVFLQSEIKEQKSAKGLTVNISRKSLEAEDEVILWFDVTGEIFITSESRQISDPRSLELYKKALSGIESIKPTYVIQSDAMVPEWTPELARKIAKEKAEKEKQIKVAGEKKVQVPGRGFIEKVLSEEQRKSPVPTKPKEPKFMYPVHIEPIGEEKPKIESAPTEGGIEAATIIGRFTIWQKQDEKGNVLELQADRAVVFYTRAQLDASGQIAGTADALPQGAIKSIYLAGNVELSEGLRTMRAEEIYYDFENNNAIAQNAVMRTFDPDRGIPVYVRAAKIRRLSESKFAAEKVTVTTSEFHSPQISVTASGAVLTDTTVADSQTGAVTNSSYDIEMHDIKMKLGKRTIFSWPYMRSNLERPDTALKRIRAGHDSDWGTSIETEWYLSRLLGLREPVGVNSTLQADYFSKRGPAVGAEITYTRANYYGSILGYMIKDSGKDDLGRHMTRNSIESSHDLRGRFSWRHRQFLPYQWQLTTEINYATDQDFIESFYRNEFNVKKQETYIHLKNIEDNRALSILAKLRINKYADELEELPTIEYHVTGESFWQDRLTLYSDLQISRFRQQTRDSHGIMIDEHPFTFVSYRNEIDWPIQIDSVKVVPYVAGTFGYDDRSGFRRTLVDGTNTGPFGEDQVWVAEAGVRIFPRPIWRVYPNVRSRLWDLDQLRHIIQPSITAAIYKESDSEIDQPDIFSLGVSQRLQTKRGPAGNKRTVDWMRLDTEFVWVEDSGGVSDMGPGPDRMLWSKPIVPLRVLSAPEIYNGDLIAPLQRFEMYGPKRDYFFADYVWRVSDTTSILGELNFDMQSGVAQQLNLGVSRLLWPNLSYYIGARYLRRTQILNEKGTNSFIFAATYILDPRYTMVFSQQYDFDYGASVRSDITMIRRYHRVSCALTLSADQSLDRHAVMFSIWPEGIKELALGDKRFIELGGYAGY